VKFDYPIDDSVLTVTQIRGARPSPTGPSWSSRRSDRLWIATSSGAPAADRKEQRQAATNVRRLTSMTVGEQEPVWSPDGQYLSYVTWSDVDGGRSLPDPSTGGQPSA